MSDNFNSSPMSIDESVLLEPVVFVSTKPEELKPELKPHLTNTDHLAEELRFLKAENALLKLRLKKFERKDVEYCKKSRCKSNSKKLLANALDIKKLHRQLERQIEAHRVTVNDYNDTFRACEALKTRCEELEEETKSLNIRVERLQHTVDTLTRRNRELETTNGGLTNDLLAVVSKRELGVDDERQTLLAKVAWYKKQLIEVQQKCNRAIKCAKYYEARCQGSVPTQQVF